MLSNNSFYKSFISLKQVYFTFLGSKRRFTLQKETVGLKLLLKIRGVSSNELYHKLPSMNGQCNLIYTIKKTDINSYLKYVDSSF